MEGYKSSAVLNLSDQVNIYNSTDSFVYQFNIFAILGVSYLGNLKETVGIPISINIDKNGELTVTGLDNESISHENVYVYSDKKVTESEE